MKEIIRYKLTFNGRVQGVGFRYTASNAASRLGVTGFVKNEYDGSVTVEIQGTEDEIDLFVRTIEKNRFIRIYDIEKEQIPLENDERGFIVQY